MENNNTALLVKMIRMSWDAQNNELTKLINTLDDEQLAKEIAPGKNTGIYLLGHLIAVSDALFPLFGWGEMLYPEMQDVFIKSPDKSGHSFPTVAELKLRLNKVNTKLNSHFDTATIEEWLSRHTAVKPEDFATQPHRNKLNVVLSRTTHMANHIGQMLLLK
ncbi:MAG: DinB family protein [Sphingobacteriales bacterium]|nr:MAG: DinB family protein [Sphingobacteriales bacterium]